MSHLNLPTNIFNNSGIDFEKEKNIYIYGPNGTGKTTISKKILSQWNIDYDVRLFNGFDSIVVENNELNAISLGEENASIQKQINEKKLILTQKNQDISKLTKGLDNINERKEALSKKIEKFYVNSAKEIKDKYNKICNIPNFNKKNFQNYIKNDNPILSDHDIQEKIIIINQKPLKKISEANKIDVNIEELIKETNDILNTNIVRHTIINFDNKSQQKWVEEGMYVQKESEDYQICSFCGNKISKDRWSQLESYFDHNVTDLKSRIQSLLDKLQKNSSKINEIEDINENIFYLNFKNEVLEINSTIKTIKLEYLKSLNL